MSDSKSKVVHCPERGLTELPGSYKPKSKMYYVPEWVAIYYGKAGSVTRNKVVIGGDGYENCRSAINKHTTTSLRGLLSHPKEGPFLLIGYQLLIPAMVYHPKSQMSDGTDASSILAFLFAEVGGIPISAPQNHRLLFALAKLCEDDFTGLVRRIISLRRRASAILVEHSAQHAFTSGPFRVRATAVRDVDKILAEFREEINQILARIK